MRHEIILSAIRALLLVCFVAGVVAIAGVLDNTTGTIGLGGLDPRSWFDGKTDAGSLEQIDGTHLRTYELQIENSARIKNVTDESILDTPPEGYSLLYTYWNAAESELAVRVLFSNEDIAECRILDTSTAADCKQVWAQAFPNIYIFAPRDENGVCYLVETRSSS